MLQELCEAITQCADATLGYLSDSANSAGACLAGVLPHRGPAGIALDSAGEHAADILSAPHKLMLTFALNPLLDIHDSGTLADNNESIIAISSFDNEFIQQQATLEIPGMMAISRPTQSCRPRPLFANWVSFFCRAA